jgi:hypothetical protein
LYVLKESALLLHRLPYITIIFGSNNKPLPQLALAAWCVTGTFILIILFSAFGIYKDKLPFSLNKIFWIFCLFFMGLAPLLQYSTGVKPFYWVPDRGPWSYLETNFLVLCCMTLFRTVYATQKRNPEIWMSDPGDALTDKKISPVTGALIFACAILAQFWLSGNLWYRQAADTQIRISNSSLQLLADKSLKGFVLYYCLLSLHLYRQKRIGLLQTAIVIIAAILANFPTAIPRYWLATFYLGIGITACHTAFVQKPRKFDLLFVSGLATLFPLLTLARLKKEAILSSISEPRQFFTQVVHSFCGQDFDAYASLHNTILYVHDHGVLWGKQLATTVLFFVPRSSWPGKSVGSGSIVNPPPPGSDFSNFSCPLFAEGYLDFSVTGAVLFTAVLAWLWSRYDRYYWYTKRGSFLKMMYPAYLALAFFMLRGDLLSSFAYTTGVAVAAWLFHRMVRTGGRNAIA